MKVIICGAGQVGYNIGRYLAVAGNDVTVIDQRAELTEKIGESLDIQAITGSTTCHKRALLKWTTGISVYPPRWIWV